MPRATQPWWVRGTFNGGKAEQKGVEINGNWNLTRNLSVEASVFLADPEFKENTIYPDGDVLLEGLADAGLAEAEILARHGIHGPGFPGTERRLLDQMVAIRGSRRSGRTPNRSSTTIARAYTGPWSTSTLQLGFSHENQWDLSLIVRNLFDKRGISWISDLAADYGTLFGDPRYQRITSIQEPRTVSLSLTKKW